MLRQARTDDDLCRRFIRQQWPTHIGETDFASVLLNDLVMALGNKVHARECALSIALALRQALGGNEDQAKAAWQSMVTGVPLASIDERKKVNDTMQLLADSGPPFDALWQVMVHEEHRWTVTGDPEACRFALQAAQAMRQRGIAPEEDSPGDLEEFVALAAAYGEAHKALGTDEAAHALACRTLLHAYALLQPSPVDPLPQRPHIDAFMAWRNGHKCSGPGTEFNDMVEALHRFTEWGAQAQEQSRSRWPAPFRWLRNTIAGRALSPLSAMHLGTMGAELGELPKEQQKFDLALRQGMRELLQAMNLSEDRPVDGQAPRTGEQALLAVRMRILEHWLAHPGPLRKHVTLDKQTRQSISGALDRNAPSRLALRELRRPLTVETLLRWGRDLHPTSQAARAPWIEPLEEARRSARAAFQKTSARPALDELLELGRTALETEGVQFSDARVRGGEAGVNFGLSTPVASLGVGIGPSYRHVRVKQGTVTLGTPTAGSDISISVDRRQVHAGAVAATAGMGMADVGKGIVSIGTVAGVRHLREKGRSIGTSIRVSKNVRDHKSKAFAAYEFLLQQAHPGGSGESISPSELWKRVAHRFVNEPDVGFDAFKSLHQQYSINGGFAAGARAGLGSAAFGPFTSAGVDHTRTKWARTERGHTTTQTTGKGQRTSAAAAVTLAGTVIPQVRVKGEDPLRSVRFPALGLGTARAEFHVGSGSRQVRVTVERGRVQPKLSLMQHQFRSAKEFIKHLRRIRSDWQPCVAQGQSALDEFEKKVSGLPAVKAAGNRRYTDRRHLDPDLADDLTWLLSRLQVLAHSDSPACRAAAGEVARAIDWLLESPQSWWPEKLSASEAIPAVVDKGLEFLAILRSRLSATSMNRYLVTLKATKPPPRETFASSSLSAPDA